jgi:hypothetical protein
MTRAFGYLQDPEDPRDKLAPRRPLGAVGQASRPVVTHNLAQLRRSRFQVGNSCVGASWAHVLQWFYARDTGADLELSAQHLYQHGLLALPGAAANDVQPDGGCYPRDVCRAGKKLGVALERDWASTHLNTGRRVPPHIAALAMRFSDYDYTRVPLDQGALLDAIADGPVQVGGPWWESWSDARANTAVKPPEPGEIMQGGHAFTALDYDLTGTKPLVLVLNTWDGWGREEQNAWDPLHPICSLQWFELEALLPAVYRQWQVTDCWTLRSVQP